MYPLAVVPDAGHPLLPSNSGKNTIDRVRPYLDWLHHSGQNWLTPNLNSYVEYLRDGGLSDSSITAHIHTIKGRYRALLKRNDFRDFLFSAAQAEDFVTSKAMVDEKITRLENVLANIELPTRVEQDYEAHVHLTKGQTDDFLLQLQHPRDLAIFKVMLATGLRAFEAAALTVEDLYQTYEGEDAIEVRHGKGNKQRMVPWGKFRAWAMPSVKEWLNYSGITEGFLFRGLWKDGRPRPNQLNPASINFILDNFPITHNGKPYTITPHDLRYTYARRAYLAGMKIHAIQANLGHSDERTTWIYIGDVDFKERVPDWQY